MIKNFKFKNVIYNIQVRHKIVVLKPKVNVYNLKKARIKDDSKNKFIIKTAILIILLHLIFLKIIM